jgi:hypothetical protein
MKAGFVAIAQKQLAQKQLARKGLARKGLARKGLGCGIKVIYVIW